MEEKTVQEVEEKPTQEIATSPAAPRNDKDAAAAQQDTGNTPQGNDRVEAVVRRWSQQAQEAKNFYPGLDMSRELQNPRFAHLLKSGVDVRTAFEVVHRDQILPAVMQAAARAVQKKLSTAMAEARPPESAMESGSPALARTDVSTMSKADRAEIIRRVQRGEIIRF